VPEDYFAAVSAPPVSVLSAPQAVRATGAASAARMMMSLVIASPCVTGAKYNSSPTAAFA